LGFAQEALSFSDVPGQRDRGREASLQERHEERDMPLAAHHKATLDETDGVLEPSADLVHDAERPAHNGKREGVVNRFGQPERLGALSERGVELPRSASDEAHRPRSIAAGSTR
jgi:hypothetical protein